MAENKVQFYQYETVDLSIKIINISDVLEGYDEIIVSIAQGNIVVNKSDVQMNEGVIQLHLSQSETGKFKKGTATLQVNVYKNKERKASGYGRITVLENLYKKVIGDD